MGHVLFATDESGKTVYRFLRPHVRIATQAHLSKRTATQWVPHAGLAVIQRGREGWGPTRPLLGIEGKRGRDVSTGNIRQGWHRKIDNHLQPGGGPCGARVRADEATARALAAVGGLPVVVDTCASLRPFSLALALIKAGFNVAAVFALHSKGNDAEAEEELTREHPEIVVVRKQGLEAMAEQGIPRSCVALGRDAAFLLHADHSPDMYHDEGLFGYDGIEKLMDSIAACMEHMERWDA